MDIMSHLKMFSKRADSESGITLVSVLFVLFILTMFGFALGNKSTDQQSETTLLQHNHEVQMCARSGLEFAHHLVKMREKRISEFSGTYEFERCKFEVSEPSTGVVQITAKVGLSKVAFQASLGESKSAFIDVAPVLIEVTD